MQRVAVLFSRLSGYMAACLQTLKRRYDTRLLVVRIPPVTNAPFDDQHFSWIERLYDRRELTASQIRALLEDFDPSAIFMAGWFDRGYLRVARVMRRRGVPVIAGCDAQWTGSLRQQVGRLIAPWYLHSAIDVLWVAGERQRQLASRLGYRGRRCWSGCYACDWDRFAGVYNRSQDESPQSFLYVGRYIPVKGLEVLVEAYRRYRATVSDPWPLVCAGAGKLDVLLTSEEGIVDRGFVQPDDLPRLMTQASAFILPSEREPWGVVVQEAAAAGLPLLCSDACGAAVHLVQDGYNGFMVETANADHLTHCMVRMSTMTTEQQDKMGERSHELSKQFTPQRWADMFVNGLTEWCRHRE